jgi:hypothetical protein
MNESWETISDTELKAELQSLRTRVEQLETAQRQNRSAGHRWFSASPVSRFLLLMCFLVLVAALLAAAADPNALFINPQGYVGVNTTKPEAPLDVNGSTRLRGDLSLDGKLSGDLRAGGAIEAGNSDIYFTNPNHDHTAKGNTLGYAAIENAKGHNSLMILGRTSSDPGNPRYIGMWDKVAIGMNGNDKPRAALDVRGDIAVSGKTDLGVYMKFETPNKADYYDVACNAGDVVLSGGAWVNNGALRESRPATTSAWRVACNRTYGFGNVQNINCDQAFALCANHAK